MAEVWRLARALAGNNVGPKQKRKDIASAGDPGPAEWREHLVLRGGVGGYQAWSAEASYEALSGAHVGAVPRPSAASTLQGASQALLWEASSAGPPPGLEHRGPWHAQAGEYEAELCKEILPQLVRRLRRGKCRKQPPP